MPLSTLKVRRRSAKSDILEFADDTTLMDYKQQDGEKNGKPSKPPPSLPLPVKQTPPSTEANKDSVSPIVTPSVRPKPRLSFKTASQATLSFLSARRKVEALKNWNQHKKKVSTSSGCSKKNSPEDQTEGRADAIGLVLHESMEHAVHIYIFIIFLFYILYI